MNSKKEIKDFADLMTHLLDRISDLEKQVFGQAKEMPPLKTEADA